MVNPRAMPFKLNFSPAKGFRLPGHAVIHATGPDSQAFLQAQCMNDVNALKDGEWQYNGWLSPQGRVFALFYVIRIEDGHFLLILPALSPIITKPSVPAVIALKFTAEVLVLP